MLPLESVRIFCWVFIGLSWDLIELKNRLLSVEKTKGGKVRMTPLADCAHFSFYLRIEGQQLSRSSAPIRGGKIRNRHLILFRRRQRQANAQFIALTVLKPPTCRLAFLEMGGVRGGASIVAIYTCGFGNAAQPTQLEANSNTACKSLIPSVPAFCADQLRKSDRCAKSARMNLIATTRPSLVSTARKTRPMPPSPSRASIRYGPSCEPGPSGDVDDCSITKFSIL